MRIFVNDQINFNKWNCLIKNSLFATPFQTPEFYTLFNQIEDLSSDVFAVEVEEEYVSLVVVTIQKEKGIKSYFSIRGIIYGGPLIRNGVQNSLDDLISFIGSFYSKKLIYLEIRNYSDYSGYLNSFHKSGWKYIPWLNFQKNISTEAIAKSSLSNARRRQINKALKSGVEYREAQRIEEIMEFYLLLKELYRTRIQKPLFSFSFFKAFFESKIAVFLLILFENKIIGGIMCPIMHEKAIYEYYVCGLDDEYKDQYPSVMATWAAIEYGIQNNIPLFDFMGAGSPNTEYGVRDFKARFGGEMVEQGRFLKVLDPIFYYLGKLGLKILSKVRG